MSPYPSLNQSDEDHSNMSMRGHVQRKFLADMIDSTDSWKVLVMDESSTKIISSALTMYDIMEHRVTLVEQLTKNRQPFPEMDVIYFVAPTRESVKLICDDFSSSGKPKYGNVHLFFSDTITPKVMAKLQANGVLASKIKTLREINIDFLAVETNVYEFGITDTLERLHGSVSDSDLPALLGRKLATVCITLNEHPCIRFQASSAYCREIASVLNQQLQLFKRSNPDFCPHGDDERSDKERGHILILDRTFDTVSPLMHEYTYQAMVTDLLTVEEGLISYKTTTEKASDVERKALLNESDNLWTELRYNHIAKVIEIIKDRMTDIIQNSAVSKTKGQDQTITAMAAAVRELPEYQQTMNKLGQHVAIAQQCMDAFGQQKLMELSQVEQTMSTGVDEDGKDVKGAKLVSLLLETFRSGIDKPSKLRLLAVFITSQRDASTEDKRVLVQAAKLSTAEQEILVTLDGISCVMDSYHTSAGVPAKTSMLSSMFRRSSVKHAPTPEGEYSDSRHVGQLKVLLTQIIAGDLPLDRYPSLGPSASPVNEAKSIAKSVRKYGANSRWGKKDTSQLSGGRYMVFIAGGVGYSELRVAFDQMQHSTKEIIIGGSNIIAPSDFLSKIAKLPTAAQRAKIHPVSATPHTKK